MNKEKFKKVLNDAQSILTEAYKKEGLTEEILETQVRINELRNILNIPDEDEKIYEDWVQ